MLVMYVKEYGCWNGEKWRTDAKKRISRTGSHQIAAHALNFKPLLMMLNLGREPLEIRERVIGSLASVLKL